MVSIHTLEYLSKTISYKFKLSERTRITSRSSGRDGADTPPENDPPNGWERPTCGLRGPAWLAAPDQRALRADMPPANTAHPKTSALGAGIHAVDQACVFTCNHSALEFHGWG